VSLKHHTSSISICEKYSCISSSENQASTKSFLHQSNQSKQFIKQAMVVLEVVSSLLITFSQLMDIPDEYKFPLAIAVSSVD